MASILYDQMGGQKLTRTNIKGTFSAYRFSDQADTIPSCAKVVICLHGFPDTIETFQHQIPALNKAGYQVIIPVMRGYEPSSVQADGEYFLNQIAQDVFDWMDDLSISTAHIVGHDWGAVTAWVMAGLAPHRMDTLTSIAIPPLGRFQQALPKVPSQWVSSWYMAFFQLGKVADWTVAANDWQFIRFLWQSWSPDWEVDNATLSGVIDTLSKPGVKEAALGYYRCLRAFRHPQWKNTQRLLKQHITIPTQIIHGANDGCMTQKTFDVAVKESDFNAGLRLQCVEGAGHFVQLEKPQVVSRLLLEFFTE